MIIEKCKVCGDTDGMPCTLDECSFRSKTEPAPVEQAGGDEREAFEAAFAAMGRPVCRADYDQDAYGTPFDDGGWTGWQARAALAQPSPKCEFCGGTGEISGVEGEDDWVNGPCHRCAYPAQAEQAEAERPEVVAWRYGSSGGIVSDKACLDEWKSGGEYQSLMTVAQHERIVKAWIERWKAYIELSAKIAAQRDAALARVAELEKQEPVAYVLFRDGEVYYETDDNIVISNTPGDETDLYRWLPVFTAPAAQAQQLHDLDKQCRDDVARALGLRPSQERGFAWSYLLASIKSCVKASEDAAQAQHSVPEEFIGRLSEFLAQRGATGKALLRELRDMLAAAPGKDGDA